MNREKMRAVCAFVKEHYAPWKNTTIKSLVEYLGWYEERGLLGVAWFEGKVAAVGTARFFPAKEHYWTEFLHADGGAFCKCSLLGAIKPLFIPQVVEEIAKRHDVENAELLWHRNLDETGPPRQYNIHQFKRFLMGTLKKT
jgi:hypothetical protein